MIGYSSRHRRLRKFFRFVSFLTVIALAFFYVYGKYISFYSLDVEKILASSQLKNRTFSTPVQEIEAVGLSAYLLEEHSVPIVSIDFMFTNAGAAHEEDDKQGLTQLLTVLLNDGAGEYDAETFKETCEEYGIKIGFSADEDNILGHLHAPRQNLDMALKLLNLVLFKPRFDEEFLKLRKQQIKTAIKISQENPQAVLSDKFAEFIFAGHPYSRTEIAKLETIDAITVSDLKNFMSAYLSRENLLLSFAGDLLPNEGEIILQDIFADLPQNFAGEKISETEIKLGGRERNIKYDSAQAMSLFAVNGTRRNNDDFYPLYLANYIFGGSGLNSRISQVIREKEGLTYGIYTYLNESDATAILQGAYSATPDNFRKAQKLLLNEWRKMAENGVTDEELQQAKDSLVASFNLRFASVSGIASMLTWMQKYNLGRDFLEKRNDYIKTVSLQAVNNAAKKYFTAIPDFVNIGIEKEEKK